MFYKTTNKFLNQANIFILLFLIVNILFYMPILGRFQSLYVHHLKQPTKTFYHSTE